jgi:hypothetical protein
MAIGFQGLSGRHPGDGVIDHASWHRVVDELSDRTLEVPPLDDPVDEAVFQQEFARLESARELHAHGLFDNARTSESDEGLRFRENEVAE